MLKIEDYKLNQFIINTGKHFRIPDFQRPYVWDESRVEEFAQDLLDTESSLCFLGSFIFKEQEGGEYLIIDGQQRIMTIAILLSALRNYSRKNLTDATEDIKEKTRSLIGEIQSILVTTDKIGTVEGEFLQCWEDTHDFFSKHILNKDGDLLETEVKPKKSSEITKYNIKKNYEYLYKLLDTEWGSSNVVENTNELLKTLDSLQTICIIVDDETEAYIAFEIVNARGEGLSGADLLKNLFLMRENEDKGKKVKDISKRWHEMLDRPSLNDLKEEVVLRYCWHSRFGATKFVSSKNLYREIRSHIEKKEKTTKNYYDKLFRDFEYDSANLKLFLNQDPNSPQSNRGGLLKSNDSVNSVKIGQSLAYIKDFNIQQPYVLLLSLFANQDKLNNPGKIILRVVQSIEKFHFAYSAISGLRANRIEKIYAQYAEKLYNDKDTENTIGNLIGFLQDNLPGEQVFLESFGGLEYKGARHNKIIRYVFNQLETHNHRDLQINLANTNIEHIQPQNPDGNPSRGSVNKIGNLLMLNASDNSSIGNKSVRDKLEYYRKSKSYSAQELVEKLEENNSNRKQSSSIWVTKDIEARTESIGKEIFEIVSTAIN